MMDKIFGEDRAKRVGQLTILALTFFSLFLIVKVLIDFKRLPSVGNEVYPQSTIAISGSGEAYAVPDIATFSFGVSETAKTVAEAQQNANKKVSAALDMVKEAGIDEKDIKTTGYNVYPKYEYSSTVCPQTMMGSTGVTSSAVAPSIYCQPGKQVLTGYEVSQTITVKVRDTSKVGDLVTQVGGAAVSNISGIDFTVDDRDKYVDEAREQAISEAKAKAKVLSKQLGVRLGKILYYSDNNQYPYVIGMGGMEDSSMKSYVAAAPTELPQGQTKITSNVTITYEIK